MSGPPTRPTLDSSWPHPAEPPTARPSLSRSHPHLPRSSLLPPLAAASAGALRPRASFLIVSPLSLAAYHPDLPPTDRSSARPRAGPVRRPGSRAGHRRAALPCVGRRPLRRPSSAAPAALLCVTRAAASPRRHRVHLAAAARERPRSRPLLLATSPTSASSPPSPSAPARVAVAPLSSDGALLPLFWPPPAPTDIARPHQCLPRARAAAPPSSSLDPAPPLGLAPAAVSPATAARPALVVRLFLCSEARPATLLWCSPYARAQALFVCSADADANVKQSAVLHYLATIDPTGEKLKGSDKIKAIEHCKCTIADVEYALPKYPRALQAPRGRKVVSISCRLFFL